jgi:acyl dehydratase
MTQQTNSEPMTAESSSGFTDFILHRLHVAALRAKIVANEFEATATALSGGLISPETAILILAETGLELASS